MSRTWIFDSYHDAITPESSLALIGNASGQTFGVEGISIRGVFDKETRRKPLAFAADAVRYGISTAAWSEPSLGRTGELVGMAVGMAEWRRDDARSLRGKWHGGVSRWGRHTNTSTCRSTSSGAVAG